MTDVFRWFMRNGAAILFTFSVMIFLISFFGQFAVGGHGFGGYSMEVGESTGRFWFVLATLGNALTHSALTFFGACLLYRIDVALFGKGASK